jgi:hypothetical protein
MAMLVTGDTYRIVKDILENETRSDNENRLANSMIATKFDYDKQLESIMQKLSKLNQGFNDKKA